jgi:Protein of unknown function (DUF3052)
MGDEARCTVRYRDRVSAGKALLETEALVFRGDFRLQIPLREIRSAAADDGRLQVVFADGEASFELGPRAARWAERIRNPRTLVDKLGVRSGSRVAVLGVDDDGFREQLREQNVDFSEEAIAGADAIVFQAASCSDLDRLGELRGLLEPSGMIWVVAPKGGREPREADVLSAGKKAGLVDVKVARFSDTHTAHKFVIPVAHR